MLRVSLVLLASVLRTLPAWAAGPPGPDVLTEGTAPSWSAAADGATASVANDTTHVQVGAQAIKFVTTGGFDTWLWAPVARNASWNLLSAGGPSFWVWADNPNMGFQNGSPWIIIGSGTSNYATYRPPTDILNNARSQWLQISIPINGDSAWTRTDTGTPDMTAVAFIEIHADTWGSGFTLWIDGLTFNTQLSPPQGLCAVPLNHAVDLTWQQMSGVTTGFDHYAVYRAPSAFTSTVGTTPIGTLSGLANTHYVDNTAINGTAYYYAVTAVFTGGSETTDVQSVGPRTPRDESDLQVVCMARTPRYPRYAPTYTDYSQPEPSGFGPYNFSAATGLGNGQTGATERWPASGDTVTYTVTVRNRGTNTWSTGVHATWRFDGGVVATQTQSASLTPGATTAFSYTHTWDGNSHDVSFTITDADARSGNNAISINTKSVAYLSYIDQTYFENFRAETASYPGAATEDFIDWLNRSMGRFNQMFSDAACQKRVHFDILQMLADSAADPSTDTQPFAVFPFRYRVTDGTMRHSGYYNATDDIDYGLLHEMGHQLGLIDLYRLDLSPDGNQVSGQGYSSVTDLMHGCSPVISTHSAGAMNHWLNTAHGYYGQYLYQLPGTMALRIRGFDGNPLPGATVKMYQMCERPGVGQVITTQVKAQGTTDANGQWTLPNVPIDPGVVPPAYNGDALSANPFGYVAVVGTNGLLHFRLEYNGGVDYSWLDITEANVAYWQGQTGTAVFDRQVGLGGPVQFRPPDDMTELNATDWSAWAQGSTAQNTYVLDDTTRKLVGSASLKFVTDGGFDTYVRYPRTKTAMWDLTSATVLKISFYADNPNFSFQNGSPWIFLKDADNNSFMYQYYVNGGIYDVLNQAQHQWVSWQIPLSAAPDTQNGWRRTTSGTPSLSKIQYIEIHADTWGGGFTLWVDGVGFDLPALNPADLNHNGHVDSADFDIFEGCTTGPALGPPAAGCEEADLDHDNDVDQVDFGLFQRCYTGPSASGDPACAN